MAKEPGAVAVTWTPPVFHRPPLPDCLACCGTGRVGEAFGYYSACWCTGLRVCRCCGIDYYPFPITRRAHVPGVGGWRHLCLVCAEWARARSLGVTRVVDPVPLAAPMPVELSMDLEVHGEITPTPDGGLLFRDVRPPGPVAPGQVIEPLNLLMEWTDEED